MTNLIFVSGEICSGKSTYAKELSKQKKYKFLEISDIVRAALETVERKDLQGHPELLTHILSTLKSLTLHEDYVISGVRQVEILKQFPDAELIWIDISKEERLKRYLQRKDIKDTLTETAFDVAEKRDNLLGLQQVKEYTHKKNK